MPENKLDIRTRRFAQGLVVDFKGDFTKQTEGELIEAVPLREHAAFSCLVLNLSEVPYINSAGIAALIRIVRNAGKSGIRSFAYGLTPHYQKLFRMVGLTDDLMIYPDEFSVMERLRQLDSDGTEGGA